MSSIACVIPAYNEALFIADVIAKIPDEIGHVVVVNDASTDATARILEQLPDPRIRLIHHEINRGVGAAVVTGYKLCLELGADIVVKIDGDDQMDAAQIRWLTAPIERREADYSKGVRFRSVEVVRRMPLVRLFGNLGLSFLTKAASGYWNIFDPTNGFTAIGREALERLPLDELHQGFFFESHMLMQLYLIDAVVVDVSVDVRYGKETSHLRPSRAFLSFPFHLIYGTWKRILWRYFICDFTAFSAFLLSGGVLSLFGFTFGAYKWIQAIITQAPTPIGTVMVAALPLILGFQLLLQAAVLDIQNVPKTPLRRSLSGKAKKPPEGEDVEEDDGARYH